MGKKGMRTNEPNGIIPERSQVNDKIIAIMKESQEGLAGIIADTGIPYSILMSLTFNTSVEVIKGGVSGKKAFGSGSGKACAEFKVITHHR